MLPAVTEVGCHVRFVVLQALGVGGSRWVGCGGYVSNPSRARGTERCSHGLGVAPPHSLNLEKIALILDIELFSPGINPDSTRFCGRVV